MDVRPAAVGCVLLHGGDERARAGHPGRRDVTAAEDGVLILEGLSALLPFFSFFF